LSRSGSWPGGRRPEAGHSPLAAPSDEAVHASSYRRPESLEDRRVLGNLPAQLTSFVGRETELRDLRERLSASRLLTLTGVGGIGKTRLELELASLAAGDFRDGVRLVELAPLTDGHWVPYAVAGGLEVREEPGRPILESMIEELRPLEMLLVLDNCEHVVVDCARLCETLLLSCASLRVLATSREALRVPGEVTHVVSPLALPQSDDAADLEALRQVEAVRLFVERAALAAPGFNLNERNAGIVAEICRNLDGIPLAIELAAARSGMLGPEQILSLLQDRFTLLTGGSVTLQRQQTLQAAIGWSYELLTDLERACFRRLAVFSGGFRLEAAGAVSAQDLGQYEAIDVLGRLVDKSLVIVTTVGDGAKRYRQLDTIRRYGLERLEEAGEAEAARRRHAEYFLQFAEAREDTIWVDSYLEDAGNFRAALEWGRSAEPEFNLRLVVALGGNWATNGYTSEAAGWMAATLVRGGGTDQDRGLALYYAGVLAWYAGDLDSALRCADQCIELGSRLALPNRVLGHGRQLRAMSIGCQGDFAGAVAESEQALELARQLVDALLLVDVLAFMAGMEVFLGDHGAAETHALEGIQESRAKGFRFGQAICLWVRGLNALRAGDPAAAREPLHEGMQVAQAINGAWVIANLLDAFALLALLNGSAEGSLRLFGAANAAYRWAGWVRIPPFQSMYESLLLPVREVLGAEAADRLIREGDGMGVAESIEYAMQA
jgi:predicted ATPase